MPNSLTLTHTFEARDILRQIRDLGGPNWQQGSHFVTVDGVPLHFLDYGTGPAIVLLHGLGAWAYSWRHNIEALAAKYRVIVPDLKGFGLSGRDGRQSHRLEDQARFVFALLNHLGVEEAVWIGNSMGGEISLHAALLAPERIVGLGLICSAGTFRVRRLWWLRQTARLPLLTGWLSRKYITADYVRRMYRGALGNDDLYRESNAIAYWLPFTLPGVKHTVRALARDLNFGALAERLHEVDVPALLLWGECDRYMPLDRGEKLAAVLPNSRLVVLPGTGHAPQEEAPETVNKLLLNFLAELRAAW